LMMDFARRLAPVAAGDATSAVAVLPSRFGGGSPLRADVSAATDSEPPAQPAVGDAAGVAWPALRPGTRHAAAPPADASDAMNSIAARPAATRPRDERSDPAPAAREPVVRTDGFDARAPLPGPRTDSDA